MLSHRRGKGAVLTYPVLLNIELLWILVVGVLYKVSLVGIGQSHDSPWRCVPWTAVWGVVNSRVAS